MKRVSTLRVLILASAMALMTSGCAVSYQDASGNRRIIGLADVDVSSRDDVNFSSDHIVDIRSLGLHIYKGPDELGFSFGYSRTINFALRDCQSSISTDPAAFDPKITSQHCLQASSPAPAPQSDPGYFATIVKRKNGNLNFRGLMNLTLPPAPQDTEIAGRFHFSEIIGVSVNQLRTNSNVALGYDKSAFMWINEDAFLFRPTEQQLVNLATRRNTQ